MATTAQAPALFVIFGGTGDLATRKLFPALAQSVVEGLINELTQFVGVGRAAKPDEAFRADIRAALAAAKFTPEQSTKAPRAAPLPADRRQQDRGFPRARTTAAEPVRAAPHSGQLRVLPVAAA